MTELQTIEVRYEDESGRHVDVYEAAECYRYDTYLCVEDGLCACCDATESVHRYNWDTVVKYDEEPSEHYTVEIDEPSLYELAKATVLFGLSVALVTAFVWVAVYGGEIAL